MTTNNCAEILKKSKEEALDDWATEYGSTVAAMAAQITNQVEKFNNVASDLQALFPIAGDANRPGASSAVKALEISINKTSFIGSSLEETVELWEVGGAGNLGSFSVDGDIHTTIKAQWEALDVINQDPSLSPEQRDKVKYVMDLLGEPLTFEAFYTPALREKFHEAWKKYGEILECNLLKDTGQVDAEGNELDPGMLRSALNAAGSFFNVGSQAALDNLNTAGGVSLGEIGDASDIVPDLDFKEQCFLLTHIFHLAKIKERLDHGKSGITTTAADRIRSMKILPNVGKQRNRTVLVSGEPFGFMNTMTQSPSKDLFFEMTNAQISTLQPMIRFYKVINNTDDNKTICKSEKEVEIVFDTFDRPNDIERMFKTNGRAE